MKVSWIRGGKFPGIIKTIQILKQRGTEGPFLKAGSNTFAIMRREDERLSITERFAVLSQSRFAPARKKVGIECAGEGILIDTGKPYSQRRFLSKRQGSRLVQFKKFGKSLTGEFIKQPYKSCAHIIKTYFESLDRIAKANWGKFPQEWILERFMKVEKAVILRDGEKVIGVMAVKKVPFNDVHVAYYIEIALMDPNYRGRKLVRETTFMLVKDAFLETFVMEYIAKRGSRSNLINWLKSLPGLVKATLYLLGRTKEPPTEIDKIKSTMGYLAAQPRVYGPWVKYENVEIYPDARNPEKGASPEQVRVAEAIIPEGTKFDPNTFVLEGDYVGIEHLIPDPSEVLWHHDERVNALFKEKVRYEDRVGRDIVLVVSFGIRFIKEYINKHRI